MQRKEPKKSDTPTPEHLEKGEFREEFVSASGSEKRFRRLDSSEIDRLYLRGVLTQDQHATLQSFTEDLMEAGLVFCPKAGLIQSGTSGHAQFIADNAFRRVKRVERQMQLLAREMTFGARMIVMAALTEDRRVSPRNTPLMNVAADLLAEVYDPRARPKA